MHIGIDGYEANRQKLVGVGTWGFEILSHLYAIDQKNSYNIFLPSPPLKHMPKKRDNWKYSVIPSKGFWTFTSLPLGIWTSKKIDVFFSPTHYIPRFVKVPRVVSIMDLSYIHYPKLFRPKDLYQLKNWTSYSIKNAQKIITISEFTKSEIRKYCKVEENKIIVAYPGYDPQKYQASSEMPNKENEYLLFVGTIQPRKNLSRLIEAFNRAIKHANNKSLSLIIVGKKGWLYEEIFQKVKDENSENRIKFLDYLADEDMPALYKNAKAFVLPSLYEGFGIPVVEAMAAGIPTVISDTSSLPEVGGNASIYMDPQSTDSIKDGILKALSLTEKEKNILIKKGYKQLEKFSWQKSAETVLKVLKDIKS